jgi:hypothetical protein
MTYAGKKSEPNYSVRVSAWNLPLFDRFAFDHRVECP